MPGFEIYFEGFVVGLNMNCVGYCDTSYCYIVA